MKTGRTDKVLEAMEEVWRLQEVQPGPEVAKATATRQLRATWAAARALNASL
jgi:hypothetical protein